MNWFARWLGKLNTTFIPRSYRSKRRVPSRCISTWNEACQQFKANCPNFYVKTTLPFRFSYDELSAAVKERYCEEESTIKHYLMLLIEYFDAILKVKIEKKLFLCDGLCISYFPQKRYIQQLSLRMAVKYNPQQNSWGKWGSIGNFL